MFNIISGLHPDAYQALSEDSIQMKEELEKRTTIVTEFIRKLGEEAGIAKESLHYLKVSTEEGHSPYTAALKAPMNMHIPAYYYLDLTKDFEIQNLEDLKTKLKDDAWVYKYSDRLCEIFGWPSPKSSFEVLEKVRLPLMKTDILNAGLVMWNKPEKALDATRFTILHEFGHAPKYNIIAASLIGILKHLSVAVITAGYTLKVIVPILTPLMPMAVLIPTAIVITYIAYKALNYVIDNGTDLIIDDETQADHFAASALKGEEGEKVRQGGIYFFETFGTYKEQAAREHPTLMKLVTLFDPHPSEQTRIKTLQNFIA